MQRFWDWFASFTAFFRHAPLHPLRVVRPVSTRHLKMITGRRPQTPAPPAHSNNEYDWKCTGLTILDTEKSKQICLVVARLNNGLDIRVCRNITPNICWSHVEIEEGKIEKGWALVCGCKFYNHTMVLMVTDERNIDWEHESKQTWRFPSVTSHHFAFHPVTPHRTTPLQHHQHHQHHQRQHHRHDYNHHHQSSSSSSS